VRVLPLAIKVPLGTGAVGRVLGGGLPDGLPGLGGRLDINSGGGIDGGAANHHPGRLANGRVVVRHPTGRCPDERGVVLDLVAGDDVDEDVENVGASDGGGDVVLLEGAALVLVGVEPGADGELEDEELAGLGEEDGGLGGDHADVLVGLHDLLDAGQGELVVLEVVHVLDLLPLVRPEHLQLLLLLLEQVLERGRACTCTCTCTCTSTGAAGVRSRLGLSALLLVVLHSPNSF